MSSQLKYINSVSFFDPQTNVELISFHKNGPPTSDSFLFKRFTQDKEPLYLSDDLSQMFNGDDIIYLEDKRFLKAFIVSYDEFVKDCLIKSKMSDDLYFCLNLSQAKQIANEWVFEN